MILSNKKLLHALTVVFLLSMFSCAPKEPIEFKGVKNITVDINSEGKPILKGDVFLHNPNKTKMKLKSVDVNVLVDGEKSAEVKQQLDLPVPAQADFSVPIEATLALKNGGLLNTVFGLLGGKKYQVVFSGKIKIAVHGISINVPVNQKQEIKL